MYHCLFRNHQYSIPLKAEATLKSSVALRQVLCLTLGEALQGQQKVFPSNLGVFQI